MLFCRHIEYLGEIERKTKQLLWKIDGFTVHDSTSQADGERTYQHGHRPPLTPPGQVGRAAKHYDQALVRGVSLQQWFADGARRVRLASMQATCAPDALKNPSQAETYSCSPNHGQDRQAH